MWGPTGSLIVLCTRYCYFNPRPPCGGRPSPAARSPAARNFNPRPPCGGRHSIANRMPFVEHFNPRPPCGGRQPQSNRYGVPPEFQSTAPVWGPTSLASSDGFPKPSFQSTAPVWGPTRLPADGIAAGADFNPRPPCGGRPLSRDLIRESTFISIHGPRVGADIPGLPTVENRLKISIHGPRVGADQPPGHGAAQHRISIHGPRVGADVTTVLRLIHWQISIHGPRVGADLHHHHFKINIMQISIHGPRVGADVTTKTIPASFLDFNPRPPCGGRPACFICQKTRKRFQSTAPVWGPTANVDKNADAFLCICAIFLHF